MTELKTDMPGVQEILESDVCLGVKRAAEDPPDDTGGRDPQDDDDIMDEFCMLERFEKLRDQTARNRTSIEEPGMKLKDPFVKMKDMTSPRDSRAIARGAACMATWLEIAGRKQPPKQPPSLKVAKVSSPGSPPNDLSGETEEEVKTKEETSSSPSSSTPPTVDFTAQNCLRPIGTRWIYTNKGETKNVAMFRHGDDFVVCDTRTQQAELLVHQLGLSRSSKAVSTPGERSKPSVDFGTPLGRDEHILYRQATVRRPLMAVKPVTAQDWNLTMELEAPENAKQLTDNLENIDKAIRMIKELVDKLTDQVNDEATQKDWCLMELSKNEQSQKKRTLLEKKFTPHGSETTSLKDSKVKTDEKQNDLESSTFNVKECNAMITETNDEKFYIIFAQFKQQQFEESQTVYDTDSWRLWWSEACSTLLVRTSSMTTRRSTDLEDAVIKMFSETEPHDRNPSADLSGRRPELVNCTIET